MSLPQSAACLVFVVSLYSSLVSPLFCSSVKGLLSLNYALCSAVLLFYTGADIDFYSDRLSILLPVSASLLLVEQSLSVTFDLQHQLGLDTTPSRLFIISLLLSFNAVCLISDSIFSSFLLPSVWLFCWILSSKFKRNSITNTKRLVVESLDMLNNGDWLSCLGRFGYLSLFVCLLIVALQTSVISPSPLIHNLLLISHCLSLLSILLVPAYFGGLIQSIKITARKLSGVQ
ncbi:hypothetical protein WR25_00899 [Diploscapter pachys]|uniref:Uncharacterized protein n=1 Tax=Diploscapter pachys TaxID=2018661 RepID=A0A2A2KVN4_9BILA|nr:hypothetical protein WR25_00899 [Diploscapter pachys]